MSRLHAFAVPAKITFSGADDETDIDEMIELSKLYFMEYGILLHPEKRGESRYPSLGWILELKRRFVEHIEKVHAACAESENSPESSWFMPELSLHICGDYAQMIVEDGYFGEEDLLPGFSTLQINLGRTLNDTEYAAIERWRHNYKDYCTILQVPDVPRVYQSVSGLLIDASRGQGIERTNWPNALEYLYNCGGSISFAGGIGPDNVISVCRNIHLSEAVKGYTYNIDMETKIRNEYDLFDLKKVKSVLEQIYGERYMDYSMTVVDVAEQRRREEEAARWAEEEERRAIRRRERLERERIQAGEEIERARLEAERLRRSLAEIQERNRREDAVEGSLWGERVLERSEEEDRIAREARRLTDLLEGYTPLRFGTI